MVQHPLQMFGAGGIGGNGSLSTGKVEQATSGTYQARDQTKDDDDADDCDDRPQNDLNNLDDDCRHKLRQVRQQQFYQRPYCYDDDDEDADLLPELQ
jgi:hypothetical protein